MRRKTRFNVARCIRWIFLLLLVFALAIVVWLGKGANDAGNQKIEEMPIEETNTDSPSIEILPADTSSKEEADAEEDYFTEYRLERERSRSQQLEILQDLAGNPQTSQKGKEEAEASIIKLQQAMENETALELLLQARYNRKVGVFVQEKQVSIVMSGTDLPSGTAEQIALLVDQQTGIGFENVVILLRQ